MHRSLPLLLAALLAATPAAAQVRVDGIVRDDAEGSPVAGVRVDVVDDFGTRLTSVVSDSAGNFQLRIRRLGTYRVRAGRSGYAQAESSLRTGSDPFLNVEIRLRAGGALREPLVVLTRAQVLPPERLEGYHHRLRNAGGRYFTRETVERLRPAYLAELVATVPGLSVARGEDGESRLLRGAGCPARVYLDGELVNDRHPDGTLGPAPLDAMVISASVEGIEVYADPGAVPAALGGSGAGCATVAVWTRGR